MLACFGTCFGFDRKLCFAYSTHTRCRFSNLSMQRESIVCDSGFERQGTHERSGKPVECADEEISDAGEREHQRELKPEDAEGGFARKNTVQVPSDQDKYDDTPKTLFVCRSRGRPIYLDSADWVLVCRPALSTIPRQQNFCNHYTVHRLNIYRT